MKTNKYNKIVKKNSAKESVFANIFIASLIGGIVGLRAEFFSFILNKNLKVELSDSYIIVSGIFILLSSLLTGTGIMDKIINFAKCGLLIPISGFAHSMTSAPMDYKNEGFIKGIGSNIFKLTGSIILYTVIFAFIFALIKGVIQ